MIEHLTLVRLIKIRQQGSLLRDNVVYCISPFKQLYLKYNSKWKHSFLLFVYCYGVYSLVKIRVII